MSVLDDRAARLPLLAYGTMTESREHLSEVIDAAQDGFVVSLQRGRSRRDERQGSVSVIKSAILSELLLREVLRGVEAVYSEADQLHTIGIASAALAAEGESPAEAVEQLVDDVRFYAEEWMTRLRFAPNHSQNAPLVYLSQLMSDEQLAEHLVKQFGE